MKKLDEILATAVLDLPGKGKNSLNWGELFDGSICFGSSGAGKTSGFLTYVLRAILENKLRPGGLILTVKKDDRIRWEKLIRACGRGDDLVIISPENSFKINLIEHELFRKGRTDIEYNSVRSLLLECMASADSYEVGQAQGGNDERFWEKQVGLMLIRMMMLLVLSQMRVTIEQMRLIMADRLSDSEVERYYDIWETITNGESAASKAAFQEFEAWRNSNFFLSCFDTANTRTDLLEDENYILGLVGDYFFKTLPNLSDKTRSIIEAYILGLSEPFLTGVLKSHFSQEMSPEAVPENCYKKGTILLLDFPLKEYGVQAIYASAMTKKLFQISMERRVTHLEDNPRPGFLFMDESHLLFSPKRDYEFQTTCRSAMIATILGTQSINNIKSALGGGMEADTQAKSLISNLRNQIFCANMCYDTNTYAANLIGKGFVETSSKTINDEEKGSFTSSENLHYIVPPEHFTTLKSGGPDNDYQVQSIMFCRGKKWSTKEGFLEVKWDQLARSKKPQQRFIDRIKALFS